MAESVTERALRLAGKSFVPYPASCALRACVDEIASLCSQLAEAREAVEVADVLANEIAKQMEDGPYNFNLLQSLIDKYDAARQSEGEDDAA